MIPMRRIWERVGAVVTDRLEPRGAGRTAIASLESRLDADENRRDLVKRLYTLHLLADDVDQAGDAAERWMRKAPLDPEALRARADVAARRGDRDAAIRMLGSVVEVRPDDAKAQGRLARLWRWVGSPRARLPAAPGDRRASPRRRRARRRRGPLRAPHRPVRAGGGSARRRRAQGDGRHPVAARPPRTGRHRAARRSARRGGLVGRRRSRPRDPRSARPARLLVRRPHPRHAERARRRQPRARGARAARRRRRRVHRRGIGRAAGRRCRRRRRHRPR